MNEEAITILRNLAERLRAAVENDNLRTASYLFSKEEVILVHKSVEEYWKRNDTENTTK